MPKILSSAVSCSGAVATGDCAKTGAPGREMQTNKMNWRINRDLSRRHLPGVGTRQFSVEAGDVGPGISENVRRRGDLNPDYSSFKDSNGPPGCKEI